jgi:hypothetical protein
MATEDREQALVSAAMLPSSLADKRAALAAGRYKQACPAEWRDDEQDVFDAIMRSSIELDDLVVLSDGRCYSKDSMRQWLQAGIAGGASRQRVLLPLSQTESTDDDYVAVGLEPPTLRQLQSAYALTLQNLYGEPLPRQRAAPPPPLMYDERRMQRPIADDDDLDDEGNDIDALMYPLTSATLDDLGNNNDTSFTALKNAIDADQERASQILTEFVSIMPFIAMEQNVPMNVERYIAFIGAIRSKFPDFQINVDDIMDIHGLLRREQDRSDPVLRLVDAAPSYWYVRRDDVYGVSNRYPMTLASLDDLSADNEARQQLKAYIQQLVLGTRGQFVDESAYADNDAILAANDVNEIIQNYLATLRRRRGVQYNATVPIANELQRFANDTILRRFRPTSGSAPTRSIARQQARRLQRRSPI